MRGVAGTAIALSLMLAGGCVAETSEPEADSAAHALVAGSSCTNPAFGVRLRLLDEDSRGLFMPFGINFYDRTYSGMFMNSNGNVTFNGANPSSATTTIPDGFKAIAAPLYGDFNPAARRTADVFFNVVGTAPERQILVTWVAVPEAGGTDFNTFQLQLHEVDGAIVFTYDGLETDGVNADGSAMSIGISSGLGEHTLLAAGPDVAAFGNTAVRFDWNGTEYEVSDGCDNTPPPSNDPPVADAGADQVLECSGDGGAVASLDGSGSSDPNGDALSFEWSEGGDVIASSETADVSLSLGSHVIDLTVDDGELSDSDSVSIVVQDTTAPSIDMTVEATELWPPNHTMRTALSGVSAGDSCCDAELSISVSGDEDDHEIVDNGDGTFDVLVRSERGGRERDGRTYEITIDAVDCAGNAASESVEVHVAHDQGNF